MTKIPKPPFSRKAIAHMVSEINSTEWKRDPDELKSSKILLEEFSEKHRDPETGSTAIPKSLAVDHMS